MSYPWLAQAAHNKAAISEGLKIVRKVIARDAVKTPLSTADLYKLVVREAPPPTFVNTIPSEDDSTPAVKYGKSGRRRIPAPAPPHPRHPVRSMSFLKRTLLPIIVGERSVKHVRETRLVLQSKVDPKARSARGAKQQQQAAANTSAKQPVETMIWLWQASKPGPRVEKPAPPPRPNVYDFSHMKASKRKAHRLRIEVAEKRSELRARRDNIKAEAQRKAEREVRDAKRATGRLLHQAQEKEALARKAERRKRWEKSNPILAKALAKQQAEAAQRLAPVPPPSKKLHA
jgi:hypothetical protein